MGRFWNQKKLNSFGASNLKIRFHSKVGGAGSWGECSLVVIKGWTNEYTKHSEIELKYFFWRWHSISLSLRYGHSSDRRIFLHFPSSSSFSSSLSLFLLLAWVIESWQLNFYHLPISPLPWLSKVEFSIRQYVSVLENHQYSTHKLCFINAEQEYKWLNSTIFWHLSSLSILYIEPIILFWNILLIGLCVIEHRT